MGGEQVEGRQAVRELLRANRRPVRDVWISETVDDAVIVQEILDLAAEQRVAIRRVPRARLDAEARTDAPQGVLAHAAPLPEHDVDVLAHRAGVWDRGGPPFLLVLDGVTDPHNLGALLRTAEVAGATGAVVARHRSAHISAAAAKAAAGAVEHLPMAVVPGVPATLSALRDKGVWTVGLDADAPRTVSELDVATEAVALVVGAEGAGLSRLARERCDLLLAVPQRGRIGSYNVAAAAAIACHEVLRRRI